MLRALINSATEAILSLHKGVIIDSSPAACVLFGLSKAELIGLKPEELLASKPCDFSAERRAAFYYQHAIRDGVVQFDWTFSLDNQQLSAQVFYLSCSDSHVIAWIKPRSDTDVDTQDELATEREIYKNMVQSAADAMLLLHDHRIMACNQAAVALFGRPAEQLLHSKPALLSPEFQSNGEPSSELAQHLFERAKTEGAQCFRWLHQRPDGSTLLCEVSLQASQGSLAASHAHQHFVATVRDVSEAAKVEQALKQSEQHFRQLFEYAPVAMSLVALDGSSLSVNNEWCRLFGYHKQNVPSLEQWWEIAYPDPGYRQHVHQLWQRAITRVSVDQADLNMTELTIHNKHGIPLDIVVSGTVIGQTILTCFSDITAQRHAQKRLLALNAQLEQRAYSDPLLGIANLNKLIEHLDQMALQKQNGRLALIDLDHFSAVNDSLGHEFGNLVLQAVCNRLKQLFAHSFIARIGSDVFAVLDSEDKLNEQQIQTITQDSFVIAEQSIRLTATCGLLELSGLETSGEMQLQNAHMALKHAKAVHRGHALFFSEKMGQDLRERMRLLNSLREAVNEQSFFMQYQPKIDLKTGRVSGVEALIRWKTASGHFIPPDTFIPLAEQSGMMNAIGDFVLRTSCLQLQRLINQGWDQLSMAVNISHSQLNAPEFLQQLSAALAMTKVPHHLVELEITETMAAENPIEIGALLQKIRDMGLKIAIDDFGVGFSSLSTLRHLPVTRLKIDRSFVHEIQNDDRIARMVLGLSQSLGLQTTAEGVETEAQHQLLQQLGCDEGQGWLYAKALTEAELIAYLQRQRS